MPEKKTWNIRERTFEYSLQAIDLFQHLQNLRDEGARIIGRQYLRSATSIGANLEEAYAAESIADFIHKHSISLKEAREYLYWLRLLQRKILSSNNDIADLICETNEIISIIGKIIVTTKKNNLKSTG